MFAGFCPVDISALTDEKREAIVKMAAAWSFEVKLWQMLFLSQNNQPSIRFRSFRNCFAETYYPVMEDGKRTVGFWSIKDSATLTPEDVHEVGSRCQIR
jgi:hypothetical protein